MSRLVFREKLKVATLLVGCIALLVGSGCASPPPPDIDGDGVIDSQDICPTTADPDQLDQDGDGLGDLCDMCPDLVDGDIDGDGICIPDDNCPERSNADQGDRDADGIGDLCDLCVWDPDNDVDGDGFCAGDDNCSEIPNPEQSDIDEDGLGDLCDNDRDWDDVIDVLCDDSCESSDDGICDDGGPGSDNNACDFGTDCLDCGGRLNDNCLDVPNLNQEDRDDDGLGDLCDGCIDDPLNDIDLDGLCADEDNCPELANPEQVDTVGDGVGDACRHLHDADSDGVMDTLDSCPYDANPSYFIESIEYTILEMPGSVLSMAEEDETSDAISLGFNFRFFGIDYDAVYINANGVLAFGDAPGGGHNRARLIPSDGGLDNFIAAYWLDMKQGEESLVSFGTQGEAGHRTFTLRFQDYEHYRSNSDYGLISFSVVLHESTGAIEIFCDRCVPHNDNDVITQGLEGPGGVVGVVRPERNLVSAILVEDAIRYVPGAQPDSDGDGDGDACDLDIDGDTVLNAQDNCPLLQNPLQIDVDEDDVGDACNDGLDSDGDEWADPLDNCPHTSNPNQIDDDGDGFGDACARLTIGGTVWYEDRLYDSDGFTGETDRAPAALVAIEVLRSDDGRVLAEGATGTNGIYSIDLERPVGNYYIRALSTIQDVSRHVLVRDRSLSRVLYSIRSDDLEPSDQTKVGVDLLASADAAVGGAMNIVQSTLRGFDLIRRHTDELMPGLVYRWQPLMSFHCGSCYGNNIISLGGQEGDPDEYDDDVILHEFGHYFSHHLSRSSSSGGSHNGDRTNPTLAYGEGFATFFSAMVKQQPAYVDNYDDSHKFKNLETPSEDEEEYSGTAGDQLDGDVSEYLVAAVLWDSFDAANVEEPHDTLELGEATVMHLLTDTIRNAQLPDVGFEGVDVADWFNAMACFEPESWESVDAVAQERGFPWGSEEESVCSDKALHYRRVEVLRHAKGFKLEGLNNPRDISYSYLARLKGEGQDLQWHFGCPLDPCVLNVPGGFKAKLVNSRLSIQDVTGHLRGNWVGQSALALELGGKMGSPSRSGAVREYRSR